MSKQSVFFNKLCGILKSVVEATNDGLDIFSHLDAISRAADVFSSFVFCGSNRTAS
ncbi:unnamed protein product [Schistosoma mattheei]|uniref:Uncharacterized protein n=1 Tax=Schistosoma mattheei TaxID=31246 RepID=A0A3P8AYP6_9TREM|nr:unnamed protein product [Schistosoma mattheei]